jgi:hypothetical protein
MGGNQAFWAGSSDSNSAPFRVGYDGTFAATQGNIAGWTIGSTRMSKSTTISGDTYLAYIQAPATPTSSNAAFAIQ